MQNYKIYIYMSHIFIISIVIDVILTAQWKSIVIARSCLLLFVLYVSGFFSRYHNTHKKAVTIISLSIVTL